MEKPNRNQRERASRRRDERGAALITVLLMATLLLMAGGALVAVTSTSAANAADATAESQAYYAAEAGMQGVLGVLRGNSQPDPLFNVTLTNDANKITFRKAVTAADSNASGTGTPRLTRWLDFDTTYTDRVVLNTGYAPLTGMAYGVDEVSDPDNTHIVAFSTSGAFTTGGLATRDIGNLRITYTPKASTTVTTTTSGATNLGTFSITVGSGNTTYTVTNEDFTLTLTQTAPWPAVKKIAGCKLNGLITKQGSNITGTLTVTLPSTVTPPSYLLDGVKYKLTSADWIITAATSLSVTVPATIEPPEPERLRVKVTGYGPRNAVKKMQMLLRRSSFDYNASGAITLRSHDDNTTQMHLDVGNSAVFGYDGNDHANGPDLPAFTVTGDQDVTLISGLPTGQVTGSPTNVRKVPVTELDKFLQTTGGPDGARATLDRLRVVAKNQKTPGCTGTKDACDRYYASGEVPGNIGLGMTNGIMTFVDGNYTMPPAGGAGLLVVTGTLNMNGNADYKGLILVLGEGHVERNGGGGDTSLGAMAIARFGSTGNFLEPTYNVQGGGNSHMLFDSDWVRKALKSAGPGVLAVSEY